jgi:hypothetical protein
LAFAVAGLAAAGFAAGRPAAAFAVDLAFGDAAAPAALGASLSAAALAFAFAGAVVLAAFATCLSLSPSIWGARFLTKRPPRRRGFPGNPAIVPAIVYVLRLSAAVQVLPQRQGGERFDAGILYFDGLRRRARRQADLGHRAAPARSKGVGSNKKMPLLTMS